MAAAAAPAGDGAAAAASGAAAAAANRGAAGRRARRCRAQRRDARRALPHGALGSATLGTLSFQVPNLAELDGLRLLGTVGLI